MWIAIRSFGTVGEFSTASGASHIDSEPRLAVALSETATLPVHPAFPRLYRRQDRLQDGKWQAREWKPTKGLSGAGSLTGSVLRPDFNIYRPINNTLRIIRDSSASMSLVAVRTTLHLAAHRSSV